MVVGADSHEAAAKLFEKHPHFTYVTSAAVAVYRALVAGLVGVILLLSPPAPAAEWKQFTPDAFAAAQEAGKPILVDVFAVWCGVCRAQNPILTQLTREPKYKDLVVFKVDFDKQKDVARALNVRSQSTLIVYKGETELDRSFPLLA